jgi:penicillin-binding protein 1A
VSAGGRPSARVRRRRRTRLAARALLVGALALGVGAATFVGGLLAAPIDFALAPPPTAALLLAADGRQFATVLPPERREVVKAADIPQVMRDAIISAEDERFLKHSGVDPLATIRAAFRDLTGSSTQGGSTLTQQYVKNAYVGNERTALRKIREAALAVRLEQKLSKQEILTDYLNALYLGNGLYGVQAASTYYFGVPVKDLDRVRGTTRRDPELALARASMLAGLAPAPSVWNPVKDFSTARVRQQYTLNRMVVGGFATPQQVSEAFTRDVRPVRLSPPDPPNAAPEFADYVKAKLKADPSYDEDLFFRGGLRVRTTLDLDLQQAVTQALHEVLPAATDPQAAIVAVDYRNGDIKAMATLRRAPAVRDASGTVVRKAVLGYQQKLGFNLATNAQRQSGSTIKPFTLAVALQEGQSLDTTRYAPNCLSLPNPGGTPDPYRFCNSDVGESGTFSLRRAMADSINTVYLPLAIKVGRAKVATLAERAGLSGSIRSGPLSFGIGGSVEVTPLSEAVAYGTFANEGVHTSPRSFTEIRTGASGTDPGQVLSRAPVSGRSRVMSPAVAGQVVQALTDVVQHGTARSAQQPFPVFGKTGTTNGSTDAWFTGCIPEQHLCVATWMGYEFSSCKLGHGLHVDGRCGGMHDLGGTSGQIYGGTVPARVFARAQDILRQIKAERQARAAGLLPTAAPTATPTPRPTRRAPVPVKPRVLTTTPPPKATRAPTPKPTVTSAPPPATTAPTLLPPGPSPSAMTG